MIHLELFWSFFQIGLFSIGGGYAAMPLIQEQIVTRHGWLSMGEFTDLVTIAEMTPGPIAINAATFVGTRVAGSNVFQSDAVCYFGGYAYFLTDTVHQMKLYFGEKYSQRNTRKSSSCA